MPRANRYCLPGYVWHITHRCHQREFLLKFRRDRRRWLWWLYEAKRRYGLCVLNYTVTCNHVHLLVQDQGEGEIPAALQLVAGRTGQEYNQRKGRKGAYWQDRYHATAVESGEHLTRCLVYIDLNMVRAGAVRHPGDWPEAGYREIQSPPQRYRIIDQTALTHLTGASDWPTLQAAHARWVEHALDNGYRRDPAWSSSLAIGSTAFVERVKAELGVRAQPRAVELTEEGALLREPAAAYGIDFDRKNGPLSLPIALSAAE